jgi:hypothetical protein
MFRRALILLDRSATEAPRDLLRDPADLERRQ